MNKYLERLAKEWALHGKIVIAVDFDSTIYPWPTLYNDEDREKVIKLLVECQKVGCYITINTCSAPERHQEIYDYCTTIDLKVHSINENPIKMPFGGHGKVYANIYLDDRAGLMEAVSILKEAMYMQKHHLKTQNDTKIFSN